MIDPISFSKDWIFSFKQNKIYKKINPPVLEKMIQALALLEQLTLHNLDFIFKGGTSLILLLEKPSRFSVDIDIITKIDRVDIEQVLQKVIDSSHFDRFELDEKRSYQKGIPKAHYFFYYQSELNQKANYILLDILLEDNLYPELLEVAIDSPWLKTKGQTQMVKVPSINSMLGDKLTAFAPTTIGIPYAKNGISMSMEINKQLFDLGCLLDEVTDLNIALQSFRQIAKEELIYRRLTDTTIEDVLNDTIEVALLLAKRERNKIEPNHSRFQELNTGIKRFQSFLMDGRFNIEQAIETAAKIAFLATCFKHNQPESFINLIDADKLIEDQNFNFLNRYRKIRNATYSYWFNTLELQKSK
ncbi:MAG: nucleotidyl transferase AbiEii/AbiGii toxin family protein [Saprospiraceae bacterium]